MLSASAPRTLVALSLSLAAVSGLASCGSDDTAASTPAPTSTPAIQLDTATVAGAIKQSIKDQRDIKAKVTCPDSIVQGKGNDFVCLAKTKDGTTKFAVQQTDDAGHVTYAAAQ